MRLITHHISDKRPFWLGFFISFLGSIPMGYLNVIALEIILEQGSIATYLFIIGVVFIELFVLWMVSKLAKWLTNQKKLLMVIDIFTIVFLLGIAYYFFTINTTAPNFSLTQWHMAKYPILFGLILNSFNVIQWPYWSGVYLYLYRTKKLAKNSKSTSVFIFGALIGTFIGMLVFVYLGKYIFEDFKVVLNQYLNIIFTFLFLALGVFQLAKFSAKQYRLIKN